MPIHPSDKAPLVLSAEGFELADLAALLTTDERSTVGIVGTPGAGKSQLATALVDVLGPAAAHVPMDGFHLADVELVRQGLRDLKGAPETFDAWGYAALLERVRERPSYPIYAPGFGRDLEQPIAGAIAIGPEIDVVVTEGNYLLLDRPEWRAVREQLDEVWYVETAETVRRTRLIARHVAFGKGPDEAQEWVERVDDANALLVEETRSRADRVIDLTAWSGKAPTRTPHAPA